MIKAVIFDMDGTMIDSEHVWKRINTELALGYNKEFVEEVYIQMMGRKDYECLSVFKKYYNLDVEVEDLIQKRRKLLLTHLDEINTKPGLFELLGILDKLSIKKAIATSSFTEFTKRVISIFKLENMFDVIITGDEVVKSKPDPTIYLETAKRLKIPAEDCLVIEDAQIGVEAGYSAGMKVIAIPHGNSRNHDFSRATHIATSMLDITPSFINSL